MDVAIIGGGAAGFFAAITVKENYPDAAVVLFEKSRTLLAKVKVSGGGRCNVTNACPNLKELAEAYPRGGRFLKRAFRSFDNKAAMQWFESRNVSLVIQEDQCVFPRSQDSQSIIDCFLQQTRRLNIPIELEKGVKAIRKVDARLQLTFNDQNTSPRIFDKVIVATGGSPQRKGLEWLEHCGHKIEDPAPSLFTFKVADKALNALMGIVVDHARIGIQGSQLKAEGPLLITHWGLSGPAILTLSSLGARLLKEKGYTFTLQVNWTGLRNQDMVLAELQKTVTEHPRKIVSNARPFALSERLWSYLLQKSALPEHKKWGEVGRTGLNRLANYLTNDAYVVQGRTPFRDEFVTCGGVSLENIDVNTMQSKICQNLYFAGEVLDIDGLTGGYNFQAAWTTAFIAAKLA